MLTVSGCLAAGGEHRRQHLLILVYRKVTGIWTKCRFKKQRVKKNKVMALAFILPGVDTSWHTMVVKLV